MVFPLAAPIEVGHHPLARVMTQIPERFARVAEFKVVAPATQVGVEIAAPIQVAVIPEGEPEEVEAFGEVQVHHFGFLTVDAQSQPALKLRVEPFVDAVPLVSGHHDEIVGIVD